MAIKCVGYGGELRVSKRLWHSNWNNDYIQVDFDHTIDYNDNVGGDGEFDKDMGEILLKGFCKPQEVFGG